jgi:hypothetical protein
MLKGTVLRDFLPLVFFIKLFLLGPVDMPRNDFNFFRLFAEIFDYFGASPVSMTPAKHAFTVLESFTGVNDTSKKLFTGVIDTGEHAFAGVNDTGEACICRCQ